jgi:PPK2 family polyphosphate:nucleotide phosphotransferase
MQTLNTKNFKVTKPIKLSKLPTNMEITLPKSDKREALREVGEELSDLQDIMYAHNKYGVLICIQGMDTAGKDSLIREVFSEFNPRGVVVHSFKAPNSRELQHDYLWRHYIALPERGKFAVFNRSHYENVLVTRVNPHFILNENIPEINSVDDIPKDFWDKRIQQINNFEKHIVENGTIVLKFFLHLGKEEQRQRLLRRLEVEKHNWKFAPSDISERKNWDKYREYYEETINKTSKPHAPWYVIPSDDRQTARYLVAKIILEELRKYTDIKLPELAPEVKESLDFYIEKLKSKDF